MRYFALLENENVLGLPLEYSELSEYFDALSQSDYSPANGLIENILREHKVTSVLDLTCGTGSQVLWLAKHGFKVTGSDLSSSLIKIAKSKAQQEKIDVVFLQGDMRDIKVGAFDAVITIFNAIGHLTKSDFEIAIKNVRTNLKERGLYIFDIFNLNSMTDRAVRNLSMEVKTSANGVEIFHTQHSEIDRDSGLLTSYDKFLIKETGKEPKTLTGQFTLQIYTAKELCEILIRNGFEVLSQSGIDGSQFKDKKTQSILTVAKKQ